MTQFADLSSEIPFELANLKEALGYQRWAMNQIAPFLGNRILEVGAGIGNFTRHLPVRDLLVASEPHLFLSEQLKKTLAYQKMKCEIISEELSDQTMTQFQKFQFDTVISFNVLEHIKNDTEEIQRQLMLLQESQATGPKRVILFVPSHAFAYGTLDSEFEHFRRYSRHDFENISQKINFQGRLHFQWFNFVGLLGWIATGRIFKQKKISPHTVKTFERLLPFARGVDFLFHKILRLPLGQSLVAVFEF